MSRFRAITLGVVLVSTCGSFIILAKKGFWQPDSTHSWRQVAQRAVLWAAHRGPHRYVSAMTQFALKTDPAHIAYPQLAESAELFSTVGDNQRAAALWLGIVRSDLEQSDFKAAQEHALRSLKAQTSEGAVLALVLLSRDEPDLRTQFINRLHREFPGNEVSKAFRCFSEVKTFDVVIADCREVDWVFSLFTASQKHYAQVSLAISRLPSETRQQIRQARASISAATTQRSQLVSAQNNVLNKTREVEESGWKNALIRVVLNWLNVPQPGQSFLQWVVELAVCKIPLLRPFCQAESLLRPYYDLLQQKRVLADQKVQIYMSISVVEDQINKADSTIQYWRSNEPVNKLLAEKNQIARTFRQNIFDRVYDEARLRAVGVPVSKAIEVALAR